MDDWLVSDTSLSKAKAQMDTVARTLESVGIEMAEDKYGFGQQLTFTGILIDTVTMSVRIDKDQAGAFLVQLRLYRQQLLSHSHLSEDSLRHLAGKLNWFSEVCQGGRIHIHSLWRCISQSSQGRIAPLTLQLLLEDLDWWGKKLTCWANFQSASGDFRLFSGSEILANKHLVVILQSDASGTDGFVTSFLRCIRLPSSGYPGRGRRGSPPSTPTTRNYWPLYRSCNRQQNSTA